MSEVITNFFERKSFPHKMSGASVPERMWTMTRALYPQRE
jgi:hypothetical protein